MTSKTALIVKWEPKLRAYLYDLFCQEARWAEAIRLAKGCCTFELKDSAGSEESAAELAAVLEELEVTARQDWRRWGG
jgi:hypothetical protein